MEDFVQDRNLTQIEPAPRKVPLSLALKLLLGGGKISMLIFPVAAALVFKFDNKGDNYIFLGVGVIVLLVYIVTVYFARKHITLLKNGEMRFATLISNVAEERRTSKGGRYTVYIMTFEYEMHGQKKQHVEEVNNPKRLQDDGKEPIIVDPDNPDKAELLDTLPANIYVDDSGQLACKYPFLGHFLLFLTLAILGGTFYYCFL